jgi:hypothetical protein
LAITDGSVDPAPDGRQHDEPDSYFPLRFHACSPLEPDVPELPLELELTLDLTKSQGRKFPVVKI